MIDNKFHELEVKFHLSNPSIIEKILIGLDAKLIQKRTHEYNLRFDTPTLSLIRENKVLRLRKDRTIRLTFKGPATSMSGVSSRPEIEFEVSDFEAARHLVEALGFQLIFIYEKYRATYQIGELFITIDELPFGEFCEIEGPKPEDIKEMAEKLGLNWEERIIESYKQLFERLKKIKGYGFDDITFENFKDLNIDLVELGLSPAD